MGIDAEIKLFIVEDNEVGRTGFRLIFERQPSVKIVGEAASAAEALTAIGNTKPDVLLIKRDLPEVNGIELTKLIKQQYPDAKVLLLASKVDAQDIAAFINAGGSGYCLSSVTLENLLLAVRSVGAGAMWLGPSMVQALRDLLDGNEVTSSSSDLQKAFRTLPLTERENDVLRLIADGLTNQQIAERLNVSTETIKTHIRRIMDKSAIRKRRELIAKAIKDQLI